MVPSCRGEIVFIAVVRNEGIHQRNGRRFIVERPLMHGLDAQAFVQRQKLRTETIYALFLDAVDTAQLKSAFVMKSGRRITDIQLKDSLLE